MYDFTVNPERLNIFFGTCLVYMDNSAQHIAKLKLINLFSVDRYLVLFYYITWLNSTFSVHSLSNWTALSPIITIIVRMSLFLDDLILSLSMF